MFSRLASGSSTFTKSMGMRYMRSFSSAPKFGAATSSYSRRSMAFTGLGVVVFSAAALSFATAEEAKDVVEVSDTSEPVPQVDKKRGKGRSGELQCIERGWNERYAAASWRMNLLIYSPV